MAPASTTVCASSGECLQISLRADAAIRFSEISGSYDGKVQVTGKIVAILQLGAKIGSRPECRAQGAVLRQRQQHTVPVPHYDAQCSQEPMTLLP